MAIGWPHERADAVVKVTGAAKYTADFSAPDMAYAVLVTSKIAKGRIKHLDVSVAERSSGVIKVFTHNNAMQLKRPRDTFNNTVIIASAMRGKPVQREAVWRCFAPLASTARA